MGLFKEKIVALGKNKKCYFSDIRAETAHDAEHEMMLQCAKARVVSH